MREQLVIKAIYVLDEACDQAKAGRVPASFGLRFALAYLYAVGDRRNEWFDREPYDNFWRDATQRDEVSEGMNSSAASYARQTSMVASLNGIARAAGFELHVENLARIHAIRRLSARSRR